MHSASWKPHEDLSESNMTDDFYTVEVFVFVNLFIVKAKNDSSICRRAINHTQTEAWKLMALWHWRIFIWL